MDNFTDVNLMFGLTKTADEISPMEKLLNEFEAHEAKEEKTQACGKPRGCGGRTADHP